MVLSSFDCVLCDLGVIESSAHLFLHCSFARNCWNVLGLSAPINCSMFEALEAFKTNLNVPFFMEIIVTMAWSIWLTRNGFIFRGNTSVQNACLFTFVDSLYFTKLRAKASLTPFLVSG
ncbi:hypothetical protein BS78_07G175000 [Paspalum vaginatum]|nr:hypothetical protein BS78_07G175000 [Paspalum vaginatum]